jgi:hypothetical protein
VLLSGKFEHLADLRRGQARFAQRPDKDEIPKRLEKYKSYKSYSAPQRKKD